jgi:hypothetical protein
MPGRLPVLHFAALEGHTKIISFLVEKQNVSVLDGSPLPVTCTNGHLGERKKKKKFRALIPAAFYFFTFFS